MNKRVIKALKNQPQPKPNDNLTKYLKLLIQLDQLQTNPAKPKAK